MIDSLCRSGRKNCLDKVLIISVPGEKHQRYVKACEELGVDYEVLNVQGLDGCQIPGSLSKYKKIFVVPPCDSVENKLLYNDIAYSFSMNAGDLYPSKFSLDVYENKRLLGYVLKSFGIPAPKTYSINSRESFLRLFESEKKNFVFKSVVGSGSASVYIVSNMRQAKKLCSKVFGIHPALSWGLMPKKKKFGIQLPLLGRAVRHNFIVQEYVEFLAEWRVILIGKYCMAYKKEKGKDGLASGSGAFSFCLPSDSLIDFVVDVSQRLEIDSAAFDVFEMRGGEFLVNEVQCNFACRVKNEAYPNATMFDEDGNPCMLVIEGGEKRIAYGEYAHNACHNLKVAHALDIDILETVSNPIELPR